MPARKTSQAGAENGSSKDGTSDTDNPPIPDGPINPYKILNLSPTATPTEIRSAYLKLALTLHPDKAPLEKREEAHKNFQRLAFAYSILKDPTRKAHYDATGSTSESTEGGFNWAKFYREQYAETVTVERIAQFKKEYQGSEEEKEAVLQAYEDGQGDIRYIFETVMCSDEDCEEDVERFCGWVEEAIENSEVERHKKWGKKGQAKGKLVNGRRKGEEGEAMAYARKLGVYEELFGKDEEKVENGEAAAEDKEEKYDKDGEAEVSGEDSGDEEGEGGVDGEWDDDEWEDEEMNEDDNDEAKADKSPTSSTTAPPKRNSTTKSTSTTKSKTPNTTSTAASASSSKPGKSKSSTTTSSIDALQDLIRSRQQTRFGNLINNLESKYVHKNSNTMQRKSKKRSAEDIDGDMPMEDVPGPTEEEFKALRAKVEAGRRSNKRKK